MDLSLSGIGGKQRNTTGQGMLTWVNPYPEILAASADYATGVASPYNTAALGNAFALGSGSRWLIYQVSGGAGTLVDTIPAASLDADTKNRAYDVSHQPASFATTPTVDVIPASYLFHLGKFKNQSNAAALDKNFFPFPRPGLLPKSLLSVSGAAVTFDEAGEDSSAGAIKIHVAAGASPLVTLYQFLPLGKLKLSFAAKATAAVSPTIGAYPLSQVFNITTSWQTFTKSATNTESGSIITFSLLNGGTYAVDTDVYIDNIRIYPGSTDLGVDAPDNHGTFLPPLRSGLRIGAATDGAVIKCNSTTPACVDSVVSGSATEKLSISFIAAVKKENAWSASSIEPILMEIEEVANKVGTGSGGFFCGYINGAFITSGVNGQQHYGVNISGADWTIIGVTAGLNGIKLWIDDMLLSAKLSAFTGSTYRAIQHLTRARDLNPATLSSAGFAYWESELSEAQMQAAITTMRSRLARQNIAPASFSFAHVAEGDSISAGSGDTTTQGGWQMRAVRSLTRLYSTNAAMVNAILGTNTDQLPTNSLWARKDTDVANLDRIIATGRTAIFTVLIGANDTSRITSNYANYYSALIAYLVTVKAAVSDQAKLKIIISTVLPQQTVAQGGSYSAANETARQNLNTLILAGNSAYDAVVDGSAALNNGVWSAGNFADGAHPNATGHGLMATAHTTVLTSVMS